MRGADGLYRWFLSRALPIHDTPDDTHPQGRILGWFGTNTDVTELREAEERIGAARDAAEEANLAKSTFIANMSHELRTPLAAIIGYSEMLTEEISDGGDPAALAEDMRKIEGNARHLLGLINDVLDLSKIESGKMEVFAETFDVETMARDVAATVQGLVAKKGNELALRLEPGLGAMHSDVTKLRQDPAQPLEQRLEVHGERHDHPVGDAAAGQWQRRQRRLAGVQGRGYGHRDDGGAAVAPFPALQPGRRLDHAQVRRDGARPFHQQGVRRHAGRGPVGRQRARSGQHVHGLLAGRPACGKRSGRLPIGHRTGRDRSGTRNPAAPRIASW